MDEFINIIKPQIINLVRDKRYNILFLNLEDLGNNVLKIYYNNKFIRYLDSSKFNIDEISRPYSVKWNKTRDIIISTIVKTYTKPKNTNVVCIIPVLKNHGVLKKCIKTLNDQSDKPTILLLVSYEEDKTFAIMSDLEFIDTPKNSLINKLKVGYNYIKNDTDFDFIMLAYPNDLFTPNWIKEGCKLLANHDIVGATTNLIIDKITDDCYEKTIDNDVAKHILKSKNNFVMNNGKIIKRCLVERINWNVVNKLSDDDDIQLFNNFNNNALRIGVIKKVNIIQVVKDLTSKEYIKQYINNKYITIKKIEHIPKKEMTLINNTNVKIPLTKIMQKINVDGMTNVKVQSEPIKEKKTNILIKKDANNILRIDMESYVKNVNNLKKHDISKNIIIHRLTTQIFKTFNDVMFNITNIHQIYISKSLEIWKSRIHNAYHLEQYNDASKASLFYGVYNETDVNIIKGHIGKKYILWDGQDILNLNNDKGVSTRILDSIQKISNVYHLAPSTDTHNALAKLKISNYLIRVNFNLNNPKFKQLIKLGNKIIIFNGNKFGEEHKYGRSVYTQLIRNLPNQKFIFTNRINQTNNLYDIYKECFVGIMLSSFDGITQFVEDLNIMGIPVIHNGGSSNSIPWKNINDITEQISFLSHCKINTFSSDKLEIKLFPKKNKIDNIKTSTLIVKYPFKISKIYSFKINGFESISNDISITIVNNDKDITLAKSNLNPQLTLNLNYIDTHIYRDIKYIILNDCKYSKFTIDSLEIKEGTNASAKLEAYDSKILDIPKVMTYKEKNKKRFTVGCILDTFSYTCFSHDLNMVPVKQDDWEAMMNRYNIDFFLFESAWHGTDGSWERQITGYRSSDNNSNIRRLIKYLKDHNIPKIFYNKEDPFNFDIFSSFASEFNSDNDLVVTTDENKINDYKKLGCMNVFAFPFCCQPVIHNPVNKIEVVNNDIIFPCTYYSHKYPERCVQMSQMIDLHIDKIHIYDRQYVFNKQTAQIFDSYKYKEWYQFPTKYTNMIKGSLNYEQVLSLYKQYKCVMNTNTVTDSKTMFARRAMEAAASGLPIISDYAVGIDHIFEDVIVYYDDLAKVDRILNDDDFRAMTGDKLYKKVMHNYTYKHLITRMVENIPTLTKKVINPNINNEVMCMIFLENMTNMPKFINFMNEYNYVLISDNIKTPMLNTIRSKDLGSIDKTYKYYFVMNEWCDYDNDYVPNMILPNLYTDVDIIGKGSFFYRNNMNLVSKELEHRFTNRLNINTIVINSNERTMPLIDNNLINNISDYLANNFNDRNMYSVDRFDFVDKYDNYHYFETNEIDLEHVNKASVIQIQDVLPVIMCVYNRINLIGSTIECLNKQTDAKFILYVWNNRPDQSTQLMNCIKKSKPRFNIYIHNSKYNVGGIGRFYLIRELLKTKNYKQTIFIDDDQEFDKELVSKFRAVAGPKRSYNWYGRKFVKDVPYFNNHKLVTQKLATNVYVKIDETFDYGGTGGMVIDTMIFKNDEFYKLLPDKFKFVEDLWMSYYGSARLGYKFIKINQNIKQIKDNEDQCTKIWDIKNLLLQYCRKLGWSV
jgi:hypothetical protein